MFTKTEFKQLLSEKILILDGAMGTEIQKHNLPEEDFRGNLFTDWDIELKGNNDLLNLTKPELIRTIHQDFVDAGSDIIETNTFNSSKEVFLAAGSATSGEREAVLFVGPKTPATSIFFEDLEAIFFAKLAPS